MITKPIYLDNAATTRIDAEVLEEMMPYLRANYGNPGTLYSMGREARKAVDKARCQVADFLGCDESQVIFTSGGSEGNNMVIHGLLRHLADAERTHILSSEGEHDSVRRALEAITEPVEWSSVKSEFHVDYLPIKCGGTVSLEDLSAAIYSTTGLVSIMYVNNELGTVNPVSGIADVCRRHGALFHTDCVQAAGSLPLDVVEIGCDFLTVSSHKIHGPKGVGAIFAKDKELLDPIVCGGRTQEFGKRGGTENVAGIVGFGKACELTNRNLRSIDIRTSTMKQVFFSTLMDGMSSGGLAHIVHVNGEPVMHNGKILNVRFDGVDAETLLLMLDSMGVCVSAGSACHSNAAEPSRVLVAAGLTDQEARSSVRVSFSKMNTQEDVEEAARLMASAVCTLHG